MIPIRTDLTLRRTPYANYAIIAINILIFLASYSPHYVQYGLKTVVNPLKEWADIFILNSARPQIWQFITYAFLHSSYQHIIGNMFFLYLFGNNVNDRLGNTGYVSFYISGSIFAAIGYSMLQDTPVLGASGAVSAVTGAYLVLFPRSTVTVLYWFILIGTFEVPAIWFILLKMVIIDNVIQARYSTGAIAYDAHLAGYAFGILATLILLATNLLRRNENDLLYMITQWNRRRRFKSALEAADYDPASGVSVKKVSPEKPITPEEAQKNEQIYNIRAKISTLLATALINDATDKYLELMDVDKSQTLPLQQQLDIANQLMSSGRHKQAAEAYEKFVATYPKYRYIEQIQLMLGLLYARYLHNSEKAKMYLTQAKEKLTDSRQLQMCEQQLKKLKN